MALPVKFYSWSLQALDMLNIQGGVMTVTQQMRAKCEAFLCNSINIPCAQDGDDQPLAECDWC